MEKRTFKTAVYGEISGLIKSMANPHRLEIIDLLANGEKSVEEIANETETTIANASQHLQTLKRSRLLSSRREKNYIFYKLRNQYVIAIWRTLREFARFQTPEINQTVEEFRQGSKSNTITYASLADYTPYVLVDVRPQKEFDNGHLEGAINIPISQLVSNLDRIPTDRNIITYCRGPFCTFADQAVEILDSSGLSAYRLEEGMMDINK